VPEATTPPDYWLVTNYVFARSYQLAATGTADAAHLAPSAIAGVAIGTVLAVFALMGMLFWWLVYHRRRSRLSLTHADKETPRSEQKAEFTATHIQAPLHVNQLTMPPRYDPEKDTRMPEALTYNDFGQRYELAGLPPHPSTDEIDEMEMRRVAEEQRDRPPVSQSPDGQISLMLSDLQKIACHEGTCSERPDGATTPATSLRGSLVQVSPTENRPNPHTGFDWKVIYD